MYDDPANFANRETPIPPHVLNGLQYARREWMRTHNLDGLEFAFQQTILAAYTAGYLQRHGDEKKGKMIRPLA